MIAPLTFTVLGEPIPKGSTKAFVPKGWTRPIVTADNPRTRTWAQNVLEAAVIAIGDAEARAGILGISFPLDGPIAIVLRFYLPRPKSAPKRVIEPTKKPDLDKLVRALKDGMTRAGIYHDDSQVVTIAARKDFAGGVFDPLGDRGVPRAEVQVGPCALPRAAGETELAAFAAKVEAGLA